MRFFGLSTLVVAASLLGGGLVVAEPRSAKQSESSTRSTSSSYINIKALHESLPGSHLHDSGCLLFRVDSCDVIVLADSRGNVKIMAVAVDADVKKADRRDVLAAVKRKLRLLYCLPKQPQELLAPAGNAALLYYDNVETDEEMDAEEVLSMPRCDALMHMISQNEISKLREVCGLACFFRIKFENVEMDLGVDLSYPSVNYLELRGCRIFRSKMKVNVEEEVACMFPSFSDDFPRSKAMFGKGSKRLRTLSSDGTFYLGRNARFFAVGTSDNLDKALKNGACYKTYGFDSPSFVEWMVNLPNKLDAASLLSDPSAPKENPDDEEDTPDEEQDENTATEPTGGDEADPAPPGESTDKGKPTPAAPVVPLTPDAARKAYLKLLREM